MPESIASGSQTATLDTDHTLFTQAAPAGGAAYFFRVSSANLEDSEILVLRFQSRVSALAAFEDVYRSVYRHTQSDTLKVSPIIPVEAAIEVRAILRQEGGTGRAFLWALVDAR